MKRWIFLSLVVFILIIFLWLWKDNFSVKDEKSEIPKLQKYEYSHFIRANKSNLYVGGKRFRSIGVNRYNLLSYHEQMHCASSFSEQDIDKMFSELNELGVDSVRFWLFQRFTDGGRNLKRFDYVLKKAQEYNIFLIPVFENHWADCTEGGVKEDSWYQTNYLRPYGSYVLSLKDYIGRIVPFYKDNPSILAWQVMNEAESENSEVIYNFTEVLSQQIKSLDKNHLVSIGVSRNYKTDKFYKLVHSIETVDLLEYHDYGQFDQRIPEDLDKSFRDANSLRKPLIVGEVGTYWKEKGNDKLLEAKIKAYFAKGGSVYLFWSYGDQKVTDDGHNFDVSDSLADVIKSVSFKIK